LGVYAADQFFTNKGNGTFKLSAIATDAEGNQAVLGSKTITCDNANAVKPFGAIDTPAHGGIAAFFPEYANSNGAAGYPYLDTTAYENGVPFLLGRSPVQKKRGVPLNTIPLVFLFLSHPSFFLHLLNV
jgi:hypothetical protein